jgi:hypothetical protein
MEAVCPGDRPGPCRQDRDLGPFPLAGLGCVLPCRRVYSQRGARCLPGVCTGRMTFHPMVGEPVHVRKTPRLPEPVYGSPQGSWRPLCRGRHLPLPGLSGAAGVSPKGVCPARPGVRYGPDGVPHRPFRRSILFPSSCLILRISGEENNDSVWGWWGSLGPLGACGT